MDNDNEWHTGIYMYNHNYVHVYTIKSHCEQLHRFVGNGSNTCMVLLSRGLSYKTLILSSRLF